jgi:hypothetical protein
VMQLPGGDEDCLYQLVDLHVPGLCLMEDLTDVVHQTLDSLDPPRGRLVLLFPLERAQGAPDPL